MSRTKLIVALVAGIAIGAMVGGYAERVDRMRGCRSYYHFVPEREKNEVCAEVLGVRR